jgi:hypothetical protein
MSTKQTRRSVSISGELYEKLKAYCQEKGASMSGMVETLARAHLDMTPRAMDAEKPKVEVVITQTSARVHPTAKPANGKDRTYGLSDKELEARKAKIVDAHRRAGNIFTF